MQVIEQHSPKHETLEDASDSLAGLSHINGFLFGYVDEKENRTVTFFTDAFPENPQKIPGQRRRTLVFAHRPERTTDLSPIFDAIFSGKDLTKQ